MVDLILPEFKREPFYFMRHGETDWNQRGVYTGNTNIPLNANGRRQARDQIELLQRLYIKTICHSPLMRALETAEIINAELHKPMVEILDLKECNWGVYEGKTKINAEWRHAWENGMVIEGAETYHDFLIRTNAAIGQALCHPGPILIISHGGLHRSILETLKITITNSIHLHNCDVLKVSPPKDETSPWSISLLTDTHDIY
jgi:broad specificity phosphatase PhoE